MEPEWANGGAARKVFSPVQLAGITRARLIANLRADSHRVHEAVLTFDDFHDTEEVILSGNVMKVTPVTRVDNTHYQVYSVTRRTRDLYWDWALSG